MKKIIYFTIFLSVFLSFSQPKLSNENAIKIETQGSSKLSPSTHYLLYKAKNKKTSNSEEISLNSFVRITLKYEQDCNDFKRNSVFKDLYEFNGSIATAFVKVSELPLLESIDCLLYADIGEKMESSVLNARSKTNVDDVHAGYLLDQAYTGEDVIIGIIDVGFDYTHPNFKDINGNLRISRVWERDNNSGTPPTQFGFNYGSEFVGETQILNKQYDVTIESHGTHVAGIAAGTGNSSDLVGMAPDSELVLVSGFGAVISPNAGQVANTFIDAIQYLKNYAQSVNKPLVVNMSFGTNLGPHDGSTLQEQAIDNMSNEQGLVMVAAAGNDGGSLKHSFLEFLELENKFLLNWNNGLNYTNDNSIIDFWGENGGINSSFEIRFQIFNTSTGTFQSQNAYYITVNGNFQSTEPINLEDTDCDTCTQDNWQVELFSEINPLNNRPHLLVSVTTNNDDLDDFLIFQITSSESYVHTWCRNCDFLNPEPLLYNFSQGDDFYTVGSPASASGVITVGSYNATDDSNFVLDDLSNFSSKGPRIDFVLKPDVTAPGHRINSSVNSFDNRYQSGGAMYSDVINSFGNHNYAKMQGTSMAAPVVSGIAALWLEAYPDLTTNDVKAIIQNTAINDSFTESLFATPNIFWGHGKIDALAGLQLIENVLNVNQSVVADYKIYPNPTSDFIYFDDKLYDFQEVVINNLLGQTIYKRDLHSSDLNRIDLSSYKSGVYILSFTGSGKTQSFRVIKN